MLRHAACHRLSSANQYDRHAHHSQNSGNDPDKCAGMECCRHGTDSRSCRLEVVGQSQPAAGYARNHLPTLTMRGHSTSRARDIAGLSVTEIIFGFRVPVIRPNCVWHHPRCGRISDQPGSAPRALPLHGPIARHVRPIPVTTPKYRGSRAFVAAARGLRASMSASTISCAAQHCPGLVRSMRCASWRGRASAGTRDGSDHCSVAVPLSDRKDRRPFPIYRSSPIG